MGVAATAVAVMVAGTLAVMVGMAIVRPLITSIRRIGLVMVFRAGRGRVVIRLCSFHITTTLPPALITVTILRASIIRVLPIWVNSTSGFDHDLEILLSFLLDASRSALRNAGRN